MIYNIKDDGVHTLLQNNYCVGLFESHFKNIDDIDFDKIPNIIKSIKSHHNYDEPTIFIIRDDNSLLSKKYKQICADTDEYNMILIGIDWEIGKMAGVQAIKTMLEYCSLSICFHDGINKVEKIYISNVDPFNTINYILYTGPKP